MRPGADGATVNGTALVLAFQNPDNGNTPDHLDEASVPAPADFAVTVAGAARTVSSVNVGGAAVTLTLASPVNHAETVTVGYTPGTNWIRDRWGNEAAQISSRTVRNDNETITTLTQTTPLANALVSTIGQARGGAATVGNIDGPRSLRRNNSPLVTTRTAIPFRRLSPSWKLWGAMPPHV